MGSRRRETIRSADEKIQSFSEAIKKLEMMMSNEHAVLTREFGEWISGYTPSDGWDVGRERWTDGLGEEWRRGCEALGRRIEGCVGDVQGVCAAVVGGEGGMGVVGIVAERWLEVARGLGEEVGGMMGVEERVVERERRGLENMVTRIAAEEDVVEPIGIWAR